MFELIKALESRRTYFFDAKEKITSPARHIREFDRGEPLMNCFLCSSVGKPCDCSEIINACMSIYARDVVQEQR